MFGAFFTHINNKNSWFFSNHISTHRYIVYIDLHKYKGCCHMSPELLQLETWMISVTTGGHQTSCVSIMCHCQVEGGTLGWSLAASYVLNWLKFNQMSYEEEGGVRNSRARTQLGLGKAATRVWNHIGIPETFWSPALLLSVYVLHSCLGNSFSCYSVQWKMAPKSF